MQTIRKQLHCLIVYELDSTIHPLPTIRRELIEAVSVFFQQQRARLGRVVKKPQSYYERYPVVETYHSLAETGLEKQSFVVDDAQATVM